MLWTMLQGIPLILHASERILQRFELYPPYMIIASQPRSSISARYPAEKRTLFPPKENGIISSRFT